MKTSEEIENLELAYSSFSKKVDLFLEKLRYDEVLRNHPENRRVEELLSGAIISVPNFLSLTRKIEKLLK